MNCKQRNNRLRVIYYHDEFISTIWSVPLDQEDASGAAVVAELTKDTM